MKLKQKDIDNIRQRWVGGDTQKSIAQDFSCTQALIQMIVSNKRHYDQFYNYEHAKEKRETTKAISETLNNVKRDRDNVKARAKECEQQATFLDGVIDNLEKSTLLNKKDK